jgi:hypothetical protein
MCARLRSGGDLLGCSRQCAGKTNDGKHVVPYRESILTRLLKALPTSPAWGYSTLGTLVGFNACKLPEPECSEYQGFDEVVSKVACAPWQNSLEGNSITFMLAAISPAPCALAD